MRGPVLDCGTLGPVTSSAPQLDSRRAWYMWGLATLAYISAVTQRTTFGVAGVAAGQRFEAGASIVSLFVVAQLLTYAALQVPAGVLVDRFGTRRVLAGGAALMALGQLALAFSGDVLPAMAARILVGAGDALTFTPVLRLLPAWFSARRLPILTQVVGMVGQLGQILSAIPFATILAAEGWTPAFASAAALALFVGVLVGALLRDAPEGHAAEAVSIGESVARQVATIVRDPAAQLAFWIHWMCASWGMLFAFMWGFPFLTDGIGLPQPAASGLMSVFALAGLPFAPLVGLLSQRAPLQRSNLAFLLVAASAVPWALVLFWPGTAPLWLLVVLVVGLATSGPGSGLGIDIARSAVARHRVGTASGFVIVAGFTACLVNIWAVGLVLDLLGGYTLDNFRWALATQFPLAAVGAIGILRARARVRRLLVDEGVRIQPLHRVLRREWRSWVRQWRDLVTHGETPPERPDADVALRGADGSDVHVVAVLPGLAGHLVAVDLPPEDADHRWWHDRVAQYLALVGNADNRIASIEVRCLSGHEAEATRHEIDDALTARGAELAYDVRVMR